MESPHTGRSESVCETPGNLGEGLPVGAKTPKPLSASLKERLKRTRRSFSAPQSVAKRLKVTPGEQVDAASGQSAGERADGTAVTASQTDLLRLRDTLKKDVQEKMEMLRRLKMAKTYRTKNDLTALQDLIRKWRQCSQTVLCELQSALLVDGRKASLGQLVDHLGLDDGLLHFDRTLDDFADP
ncbi:hypothetical protein GN956_G18196 [Arapaima gigas]